MDMWAHVVEGLAMLPWGGLAVWARRTNMLKPVRQFLRSRQGPFYRYANQAMHIPVVVATVGGAWFTTPQQFAWLLFWAAVFGRLEQWTRMQDGSEE